MAPVRVVVVDDHAVVRDGLHLMLSQYEDIEVVATAADGIEAIQLCRDAQPDIVLMDLGLPKMDGVEATRRILATQPTISVIALTMSEDDDSVRSAVQGGARGYLLKESSGRDVVEAIRAVAHGKAVFGVGVAEKVLQMVNEPRSKSQLVFPQLTAREHEILGLVAEGMSNPAIARRLQISPKTVSNILSCVLVKISATNRQQAIDKARAAGLGTGGFKR